MPEPAVPLCIVAVELHSQWGLEIRLCFSFVGFQNRAKRVDRNSPESGALWAQSSSHWHSGFVIVPLVQTHTSLSVMDSDRIVP